MRGVRYGAAVLGVGVITAAAIFAGLAVRPASAADVNPYVGPLRSASAKAEASAKQITALASRGGTSASACRTAANRLAGAAADAEKVLRSYENARLRYGTREEFGLLRSLLLGLVEADGNIDRVTGATSRPPTAGEQSAARRDVSLFRQVVAARVAERFQIEGLQDVLTARSLREMRDAVINEVHGQVKTAIEKELRRITGVGISLGVPLKVQIRRHAELALSRLLDKLVVNAGPAGILIQLVAGKFVDPARIVRVLGAKLREALRPKGNLAARTTQSLATLEKSRRTLNAIPANVSTALARRTLRDAERTLNATRFLEGDLRRAGDTKRLGEIAAAKRDLERTMRLTRFRFLLDAELLQYNFRDAIAFARRAQSKAAAAAKKCDEKETAGVFTGSYDTTYGKMILRQSGNRVTGCYEKDKGTLSGTVSGKVLFGTWKEEPHKTDTDRGGFVFTKTGSGFTGKWNYDRNGGEKQLRETPTSGGNWNGSISQTAPKCTP